MRRFQQAFTQIEMDLDVFGKKIIAADLLHLCVEYWQSAAQDKLVVVLSLYPLSTRRRSTVHFHFRLTLTGAPPRPIIS